MKASAVVASGVVQCAEGRKLFPQMSVMQNLMMGAYVHRRDRQGNRKRLNEVLELFPILADKADEPAGSLSGGQQQMVAIGRAMMSRPRLLMLDEPSLAWLPWWSSKCSKPSKKSTAWAQPCCWQSRMRLRP